MYDILTNSKYSLCTCHVELISSNNKYCCALLLLNFSRTGLIDWSRTFIKINLRTSILNTIVMLTCIFIDILNFRNLKSKEQSFR